MFEFLQQWYAFFPEFQTSKFYAFGESYGGKWVPTVALKIHNENLNPEPGKLPINLAGIGIGDGFISPPETARYAWMLYEA